VVKSKKAESHRMKRYWEIISDNLKQSQLELGCLSALHCEGRTIWIADAHRGGGRRPVVRMRQLNNFSIAFAMAGAHDLEQKLPV
jgi:hypothetical protein